MTHDDPFASGSAYHRYGGFGETGKAESFPFPWKLPTMQGVISKGTHERVSGEKGHICGKSCRTPGRQSVKAGENGMEHMEKLEEACRYEAVLFDLDGTLTISSRNPGMREARSCGNGETGSPSGDSAEIYWPPSGL